MGDEEPPADEAPAEEVAEGAEGKNEEEAVKEPEPNPHQGLLDEFKTAIDDLCTGGINEYMESREKRTHNLEELIQMKEVFS